MCKYSNKICIKSKHRQIWKQWVLVRIRRIRKFLDIFKKTSFVNISTRLKKSGNKSYESHTDSFWHEVSLNVLFKYVGGSYFLIDLKSLLSNEREIVQ